MNVEELFKEALEGGLTITRRGPQLVVRGSDASEELVHRLLSSKPKVMAALDRGQELIQAMKAEGFKMNAIGFKRLRVTPASGSRLAAIAPLKFAIITILRAETSVTLQIYHDLDEEDDHDGCEKNQKESRPKNNANAELATDSGNDVSNADWEAEMGRHATGIRPTPCYERCSGHAPYLPPIPDQAEKESGGGEDAASPVS